MDRNGLNIVFAFCFNQNEILDANIGTTFTCEHEHVNVHERWGKGHYHTHGALNCHLTP